MQVPLAQIGTLVRHKRSAPDVSTSKV